VQGNQPCPVRFSAPSLNNPGVIMTNERKLITLPVNTPCALPCDRWAFYRDDRGVFAVREQDLSLLTAEQRAAYDVAVADLPPDPPWFDERDERAEAPRFHTLPLAKQYAALCDEEECVSWDQQCGYQAPGECYTPAYRSIELRRDSLLEFAI
jgi:hypothetical protein